MPHVYNDFVLLGKLEQAIEDLADVPDESAQRLRRFLREAVAECREFSRVYDEGLLRQLSGPEPEPASHRIGGGGASRRHRLPRRDENSGGSDRKARRNNQVPMGLV